MRGTQGLNPKLNLSVLEDVLRAPVEAGDPRKCCFDFSTFSVCKKDVETMILVNLRGGALQGVPIEAWRAILCVFHSGFRTRSKPGERFCAYSTMVSIPHRRLEVR